jgi:hypothetical protein
VPKASTASGTLRRCKTLAPPASSVGFGTLLRVTYMLISGGLLAESAVLPLEDSAARPRRSAGRRSSQRQARPISRPWQQPLAHWGACGQSPVGQTVGRESNIERGARSVSGIEVPKRLKGGLDHFRPTKT